MARPKTEYVNLVKSQLTDRAYAGVCRYRDANRISESRAIADLVELIVCGTDGSMPANLLNVTSISSINGPETQYAK